MNDLRFACADFTFPLLPHDKVLRLISLLDCQGVDIGLFTGRSHLTAESEFEEVAHSAKTLRTQLETHGLMATDVYLQLDTSLSAYAINHPEKQRRQYAREQFLKLIEYSRLLGADHITCLPGMHFPEVNKESSVGRCYEELSWRLEKANSSGLTFAVEVHIGSPFIDPVDTTALLAAVPGLTLTLDYTHFIYCGYTEEDVDPFLPHASHFHARGAKPGRLQTSMSENTIDYKQIIGKLKRTDYQGWIGLEYIWTAWERCNEADTLSETILLRDLIQKAF